MRATEARSLVCLTVFVLAASSRLPGPARAAQPQPASPAPIFRIETDEFWLNLHHFLYVLGRAEAKLGDMKREAVVDAPAESERGLQNLTADEQKIWAESVTAYATGISRRDAVFDEPLVRATSLLAEADDAPALAGVAMDASLRQTLERAAPVYSKAWWPDHRASNRAWRASMEALIATHGRTVLDFITRGYGFQWPASGFAVHASRFSNWAGAYSSSGGLLVIASGYPHNAGRRGLEGIFHEGMHQWDAEMYRVLEARAKTIGASVPSDLPHALIWVTAGEAVRRLDPKYVPTADALGVWNRGSSGARAPLKRLKQPLVETWLPYLAGTGTRDEALTALLAKISASRPPAP